MTATKAPSGFPEIVKFEPKCKLCQLAATRRGIVEVAHKYRLRDSLGDYAIASRINPILEKHSLNKINARSIGRHFDSHVDFATDAIKKPEEVIDRITTEEAALLSQNVEDAALGRNDVDYYQMWDLFRRLMRRIVALDSDPTAFLTDDGKHSMERLKNWTTMITGAKSIIEGLNKMRNQDRMTVHILEQHTKNFATQLVAPIADQLRTVVDECYMLGTTEGNDIAARLQEMISDEFPTLFTKAAGRSLQQSREQYKLH